MIGFFNGKFLQLEKIAISPFDRGFQFSDGVYEVIRVYNGKLFRINDHLERLENSIREIGLRSINRTYIKEVIYTLIDRNKGLFKNFVVYIQVTRGAYFPRTHAFPPKSTRQTLFIYLNEIERRRNKNNSVKVILGRDIRWEKCNVKSISLLPNILANQNALENKAHETLFVRNGFITEGTHSNFFCVRNGEVFTPPLTNYILPGITRKVVLEICKKNGIRSRERKIKASTLKSFEEFFLTSTTGEIKPVLQIDNWKAAVQGKVTSRLTDAFRDFVKTELYPKK